GPVKVPDGLTDEQVLFLGDILPTGWQAVVQCDVQPNDTVAIWGAGPVGQMAIRSAVLLGARQVVVIDNVPERLDMARAGGAITLPGVYGGLVDKIPFGALMNKGLTIRTGQTHVNRWTSDLLRRIQEGQIDPSFVITHSVPLEQGPEMYRVFRDKEDGCIKTVLKPGRLH